ncbi:Uncharacterised protein [Segatella copri]|nr:Uncharacterised protein [Segatella copri]
MDDAEAIIECISIVFHFKVQSYTENVIYPKKKSFILHYRQKDLSLPPKIKYRQQKQCAK